MERPAFVLRWLFDSEHGDSNRLIPRWLFLRALGLIYFSAFYSLVFQIRGLIGPRGISPAGEYLEAIAKSAGHTRYWLAPTLLWFSSGSHMLMALCWVGMAASLLIVLNWLPRPALLVCFVCFLSLVSAASDFSGYQSDGMLLEAGLIAFFLAPAGIRPGWSKLRPPARAPVFLLVWECFRIYFGSGVAKIASGDPQWRNLTAMDEYYQNGPLPTWIGWYAQHLPHRVHVFASAATLVLELGLIWIIFLPRRWRIAAFFLLTAWQIPVIFTANYTFLNYLVLILGILLLDDRFLKPFLPRRWRENLPEQSESRRSGVEPTAIEPEAVEAETTGDSPVQVGIKPSRALRGIKPWRDLGLACNAVLLTWLFYASAAQMVMALLPWMPLPTFPIQALEPFRVADRYGLFAVMTRGRYEIEFQGSDDGQTWMAYPFRYKPQDPSKAPGIYAPYQPRFDWNLWFASLESWRSNSIVVRTEERLLSSEADVITLFAENPFPQKPPKQVRAVLWRYWFTTLAEKRERGLWWRCELLGLYAPTLERGPEGKFNVVEWPAGTNPGL